MAEHSTIEWTDATWQIITGCEIESPGCKNCYAMKLAGGRLQHHPSRAGLTKPSAAGPVWTGEIRFNEKWLRQPVLWKRGRMIFVCAHSDLFHPSVPFEWIDRVFAVMLLADHHTYQVLTKRTARMAEYVARLATREGDQRLLSALAELCAPGPIPTRAATAKAPFSHIWLGTSVENQHYADVRREPLRQIAAVGWLTWVSYEPALGPVDWTGWEFIRWMVSGGESGAGARPHHPQWHRDSRDFCERHGRAYNFKQWGCWAPPEQIPKDAWTAEHDYLGGQYLMRVSKGAAGRLLDGVTHDGFPS